MSRFLSIIVISFISISVFGQKKWQQEGVKIPAPICYGSDHSHKHYNPPPAEFLKRLKSTNDKKAEIIVDYIGFSDSATVAFQYAVDIWETLIYSPVPIHMLARWSSLDDDVLGSCGPYIFFENFDAAHYKDRYYPVALVEKMEGEEVTGAETPDMVAQFNKDFENWYFGTDGNTPEGKYDFVSIVLHEIAHGLGFTGFFYVDNDLGHYGGDIEYPGVFDEFVVDGFQKKLIDTTEFENHSADLFDALNGPILNHTSPSAKAASEFNRFPKLYAPDPFDEGSSIYHLNESTYGSNDPNSLMTPFADRGSANHNPGPLTMGIFADMGWQFISIKHDEITDTENINETIKIDAQVFSDAELDSTSIKLIYSASDFETEVDTLQLVYNESTQIFEVDFPELVLGKMSYYIAASDVDGITYRLPGIAPERVFDLNIGPDLIKPEIAHTPIRSMLESDLNAELFVEITENIGIAEAKIEYLINNENLQSIDLALDSANIYKAIFAFENLTDGDSISYRIKVIDSSSNSNEAFLPEDEYFTFYIDGTFDPVREYFTDFNASNNRDFISNDFYVGIDSGFDDGALHSPHPYPSPNQDETIFEFVSLLKYPIIIKNGGEVSFKEIVLVEPGEADTNYGDEEFWDYAIIEGSKNGIDNWLPLVDGYDSRENPSWLSLYNGSISGNNSTATGHRAFYIQRDFYLTDSENFAVNDTIFMRFRIYSDPYAHGWGWAIDDLSIQDINTSKNTLEFSPGEISVFPNPTNSQLNIHANFKNDAEKVKIQLLNSSGILIHEKQLAVSGNTIHESMDIRAFSPGLYLLVMSFENGQIITRKIVKD